MADKARLGRNTGLAASPSADKKPKTMVSAVDRPHLFLLLLLLLHLHMNHIR